MRTGKRPSTTIYGWRPAMADSVQFKIEGLEELQKQLKKISEETSDKSAKFALRKSAQLVAKEAAEGAKKIDDPNTAEEIAKNIVDGNKYPGVRARSARGNRAGGGIGMRVGVQGGAGGNLKKGASHYDQFPGGDTRHWRFWEFGTEKMRAVPFMRPALSQNVGKAISEFVSQYRAALKRRAKVDL